MSDLIGSAGVEARDARALVVAELLRLSGTIPERFAMRSSDRKYRREAASPETMTPESTEQAAARTKRWRATAYVQTPGDFPQTLERSVTVGGQTIRGALDAAERDLAQTWLDPQVISVELLLKEQAPGGGRIAPSSENDAPESRQESSAVDSRSPEEGEPR